MMMERGHGGATSPTLNGKLLHGLPLNLPKIESNESNTDAALLDVMGIDDYLSLLKNKTDGNPRELWKETVTLAHQLKASRELIAIGSSVYSNKVNRTILDRLIESSHIILNAERVYLLEIDPTGAHLIVTCTKEQRAIGRKIPLHSGIEGESCEFVALKYVSALTETSLSPRLQQATLS
jgi:hypothetical protein